MCVVFLVLSFLCCVSIFVHMKHPLFSKTIVPFFAERLTLCVLLFWLLLKRRNVGPA